MASTKYIEIVVVDGGTEKRHRWEFPYTKEQSTSFITTSFPPDTIPELPAEADIDDVIAALITLGLVTQAE